MPKNPPPSVPIVSFPTPQVSDRLLVEIHSTEVAAYDPVQPGTPHPDIAKYPGFVFVSQQPADDDSWVRRIWVNERAAQDVYNAAKVEYAGESEDHPIYIRQYLERRGYSTRSRGLPLTGIVFVRVTAGGSGYTTPPLVGFSGTGGGAAAFAVVFRGAVVGIVLTSEGNGYTDSQTVTMTGGGGSGASAFAQIQPVEAVLIKEEESRIEGPLDGLYVNVTRTYYSLPGPYLPFTRYDDQLGPVQGRRRAVRNTGQAASLSGIAKKTYEAMESSSIVSWEIEENWSDGSGTEGNPAYPIRISDDYDNDRGPFQIIEQVVVKTGDEEGSIVEVDGLITKITYVPINEFLLERHIESWEVPGPELVKRSLGQESLIPAKYRRLITTEETRTHVTADTPMPGALTGDQTSFEIDQQSEAHAVKTVVEEVIAVDEDPLPGSYTDEQGVVTTEESVVVDGTAADSGFQIKSSRVDPFGNGKSKKEVDTYPTFVPQYGTHVDEATGIRVDYSKTIVAAGTTGGVSGANYVEITPLDKWRSIAITNVLNADSLPAAYTYEAQIKHSFPNVIESSGMEPTWIFSTDGTRVDIGVTINDISGYSGPCNARITERYLTAAAYATYTAPIITKFWPEDFTFSIGYAYTSSASLQMITIPESLHPEKDITWFGSTPPLHTITVPATNPTTLPFGQYIHAAVEPERWRFGVWKVTEIEVLVPTL